MQFIVENWVKGTSKLVITIQFSIRRDFVGINEQGDTQLNDPNQLGYTMFGEFYNYRWSYSGFALKMRNDDDTDLADTAATKLISEAFAFSFREVLTKQRKTPIRKQTSML